MSYYVCYQVFKHTPLRKETAGHIIVYDIAYSSRNTVTVWTDKRTRKRLHKDNYEYRIFFDITEAVKFSEEQLVGVFTDLEARALNTLHRIQRMKADANELFIYRNVVDMERKGAENGKEKKAGHNGRAGKKS